MEYFVSYSAFDMDGRPEEHVMDPAQIGDVLVLLGEIENEHIWDLVIDSRVRA